MRRLVKALRAVEHAVVLVVLVGTLLFFLPLGRVLLAQGRDAPPASANCTVEETSLAGGLSELLPDIGRIYRKALDYPLQKVEGEIRDPDIREFYQGYLREAGLGGF